MGMKKNRLTRKRSINNSLGLVHDPAPPSKTTTTSSSLTRERISLGTHSPLGSPTDARPPANGFDGGGRGGETPLKINVTSKPPSLKSPAIGSSSPERGSFMTAATPERVEFAYSTKRVSNNREEDNYEDDDDDISERLIEAARPLLPPTKKAEDMEEEEEDDDDDYVDEEDDNGLITDSDVDTADEGADYGVRQTRLVRISENPIFNENFQFTLSDAKSFVNVVLWCKCPEKLDKAGRVTRAERDELCGFVSLKISEIVLQCIMTEQGDHQETVGLTCPEPLAQASRSGNSGSIASHRGHNPLLMDGDVTLAYRHVPAAATTAAATAATDEKVDEGKVEGGQQHQQQNIVKTTAKDLRVSSSSLKKDKRMKSERISNGRPSRPRPTSTEYKSASSSSNAISTSDPPNVDGRTRRRYSPAAALTRLRAHGVAREEVTELAETNHVLVSTHFSIATSCNSCHNKIWTRKAFRCKCCSLVCHKKCIGKFQSEGPCSKVAPDASLPDKPEVEGVAKTGGKVTPPTSLAASNHAGRGSIQLKSPIRLGPDGGIAVDGGGFTINIRTPKSPTRESVKGLYGKAMAKFVTTPRASPGESPHGSPDLNRHLESTREVFDSAHAATADAAATTVDAAATTTVQRFADDNIPRKEPSPGYQIPSSSSSSSEEKFVGGGENEEVLSKLMSKCGLESIKSEIDIGAHDEVVVSVAKSTGKELFADLAPEKRKVKLEQMTSKLQVAIDAESENRSELSRELKEIAGDAKAKHRIGAAIQKSEDRMQSMAVLMLHYCSGLADCLENFDSDKEEVMTSDSEEEETRTRIRDQEERVEEEEEEEKAPAVHRIVSSESRLEESMSDREEEEKDEEENEEEDATTQDPGSINDGDIDSDDEDHLTGKKDEDDDETTFSLKYHHQHHHHPIHEKREFSDSTQTPKDDEVAGVIRRGDVETENGVVEMKGAASRCSVDSFSGASEASEAEEALDVDPTR